MSEQTAKITGHIVAKVNTLDEANSVRNLLMASDVKLWLFVYKQEDSYVVEANNEHCNALSVIDLARVKHIIDENETAQLREMINEAKPFMPGKPPDAYDDVFDYIDEDFDDTIE